MKRYFSSKKTNKKSSVIKILSTLVIFAIASFGLFSEAGSFVVGETLYYNISVNNALFGKIVGGRAMVTVSKKGTYKNRNVYYFDSKVRTVGTVDGIFRIRDRFSSIWDYENKAPLKSVKIMREGGYKRDYYAVYDPAKGIAAFSQRQFNGNTKDLRKRNLNAKWTTKRKTVYGLVKETQDIFTSVFYLRQKNDKPYVGAKFSMPIFDDGKKTRLSMKLIGKKTITTAAGTFPCWISVPKFNTTGFFKHEGTILVYVSDDEYRIPIKVVAKIPIVGAVTVELVKVKR